jgi:hypothetical protein
MNRQGQNMKLRAWFIVFICVLLPVLGNAQVRRLTIGDLWESTDGLASPQGLYGLYMIWPGGHEQAGSLYEGGFRSNSSGAMLRPMFREWETVVYDTSLNPIDTLISENYHPSYALKEEGVAWQPRTKKSMRAYRAPTTVITQDGVVHLNLVEEQSRYLIHDKLLISDEMLEYTQFYAHGFFITSKYYAWANQYHDDYVIRVVEIVNNGNTDDDEWIESPDEELLNNDLENLYLDYYVNNLSPNVKGEGYFSWDATGTWDNWHDYYGDQPGDSLRYMFASDGDDATVPGDDRGDPFPEHFADDGTLNYRNLYEAGEFVSSMYAGYGVLYVARQTIPWNHRRWAPGTMDQPYTYNYGDFSTAASWRLADRWDNVFNGGESHFGHPDYNEDVPKNQESVWMGLGPFDIPNGQKLVMAFVHAVNGLSVDANRNIGRAWLNGEISKEVKDGFLGSGRDSLAQTIARAQWNWDNYLSRGLSIPNGPSPPENLVISSGVRQVNLAWDSSATSDVDQYKIYRKSGDNLGKFDYVAAVADSVYSFADTTVKLGVSYYYYVTAANDGSSNVDPTCFGQPLESSKYFNRSYHGVTAYRAASKRLSEPRVVPNPYHMNQVLGWEGEVNKLMFTNLSERCTVRIFTVNGDLVKTLKKDNPSAYIYWSPMLTDDNLFVAPDVYIFHVTDDDTGETAFGKFVVVR